MLAVQYLHYYHIFNPQESPEKLSSVYYKSGKDTVATMNKIKHAS